MLILYSAQPEQYKNVYKWGFLAYAILGILAGIFYRERVFFGDIAFQSFDIVRTGAFAVQHHRFVAYGIQAFPLAARLFNFPLAAIALSYSLSAILFGCICYVLCGTLRQYRIAVMLLLAQILILADTFYWILNELTLGISVLGVVLALLNTTPTTKYRSALRLVYILAGTVIVVFAHPLAILCLVFSLLFLSLRQGEKDYFILLYTAGAAILILTLKKIFFAVSYEDQATPDVWTLYHQVRDVIHTYALRRFVLDCIGKYLLFSVTLIWASVYYVRHRQWLFFALVVLGSIGFAVLVTATHPNADTPAFYIENLYQPLGVFLALSLVYHLLPGIGNHVTRAKVVAVIATVCVVRAGIYHTAYTERLHVMEQLVYKCRRNKCIMPETPALRKVLFMTWASPYEAWLISTMKEGAGGSLVITDRPDDFRRYAKVKNAFVGTWGALLYTDLPRDYFRFTDTTTAYRMVELR